MERLDTIHTIYEQQECMYDNFCGDTFVPIEPDTVIEGLEQEFPEEWLRQVTIRRKKSDKHVVEKKHGFLDMLAEVGL